MTTLVREVLVLKYMFTYHLEDTRILPTRFYSIFQQNFVIAIKGEISGSFVENIIDDK